MNHINCYTYLRVSTAMQVDAYSLDAQRERLTKYAYGNDFCIVGEYCDAGKSGKNLDGRPDFKRMLDDIQAGKDFPPPMHLRDSHYKDAKKYGFGEGYIYSHSAPDIEQQFLPDELVGRKYTK